MKSWLWDIHTSPQCPHYNAHRIARPNESEKPAAAPLVAEPGDDWTVGDDGDKFNRAIYFLGRHVGTVATPGIAIMLVTAANERDKRRTTQKEPPMNEEKKRDPIDELDELLTKAEAAIEALGFRVSAGVPLLGGIYFLRWSPRQPPKRRLVVITVGDGEELSVVHCTKPIRVEAAGALGLLVDALRREQAGHDTEIAKAIVEAKAFLATIGKGGT